MNLRVAEELHDAEASRMARIATAGREKGYRFYCGVLVWFGTRMVRWGQRLQARYSSTAPVSLRRSANRLAN